MEWLSGWLKELILVVMLATFVDLMLPSPTMQRYVRTVLGLFILMLLVQPVLAIFHEKWDTAKLSATIDRLGGTVQTAVQTGGGSSPLQASSLHTVLQEAEKMKTGNRNQSWQLTETRMAQEINRLIAGRIPVEAVQVNIAADAGPPDETRTSHLKVILQYLHEEGRSHKGGNIRPIAPVSVQIEIGSGSSPPVRSNMITPEMEKAKRQLTELLQEQWQLTSDQVTLVYDTENSKMR